MRFWLAVVFAWCALGVARADTLSPEDLARKNEGGYVTGLPLAAYSTDIGLGGGARVYYYWDGDKADARFARTPYLQRVFLQAFASTRGLQFHWLDYDAPRIFDTPYRIRSQLIYYRAINQNYFGYGSAAVGPLRYAGSDKSYGKYDDYLSDESRVLPDGSTYAKYDQYDLQRPIWVWSIERLFLADKVRVLGGFGFSYATIKDYTGKQVDAAGGAQATEAQTRLAEDCHVRDVLHGCDGGWDNYLRFGVSYDTRDFEPDPNSGVYADLAVDAGTKALGSEYQYVRALAAARGYWTPDPAYDLVLAARGVVEVQTKGTPFTSMDTLPFTEDPRTGLGGHRTMRGFKQDRFVGNAMTLVNAEVRWTFTRFEVAHQKLALIAAPFLDTGRSFDRASDLGFHAWRLAYGGALRISWNLATLVTIDYGRSSEDSGLYINFGHIF